MKRTFVRLYVNVESMKSSQQNKVLSTTAEIGLEGEVLQVPAYGSAKGDKAESGSGVEIQGRIE